VSLLITRQVSSRINQCQLSYMEREAIDVEKAIQQHRQYEQTIVSLGYELRRLPPLPDSPDAAFVEDIAVVLDELAIITRPGVKSRRGETDSASDKLSAYRTLCYIESPGTLEGGDILRVGRMLFAGWSERTNPEGIRQLQSVADRFDYTVKPVEVNECLHLKTGVTQIGADTLLINPQWIPRESFAGLNLIEIDPREPFAANALWLDKTVVYPAEFSRTKERLLRRGFHVRTIPFSELLKAEAGLTCCSLIVHTHGSNGRYKMAASEKVHTVENE